MRVGWVCLRDGSRMCLLMLWRIKFVVGAYMFFSERIDFYFNLFKIWNTRTYLGAVSNKQIPFRLHQIDRIKHGIRFHSSSRRL